MTARRSAHVVLVTERLRLRLPERGDAPALFKLYADSEVMRYWNHDAWTSLAQAETAIADARDEYANGTSFQCVIEELTSRTVVGSCALYDFVRDDNSASLGYLLSPPSWGKGYLTEAMGPFLSHAFVELQLDIVQALINPKNIASARLLEKLGFVSRGWRGDRWTVAGETCHPVSYALQRTGGAAASLCAARGLTRAASRRAP